MSQFHLKFSFGLPVYGSCHCQEPTIGRRSPFSMHQALRKKPADSWHQRSWNLVLGFLGVVVVFESVGKGPGRKLSFGVDQNIQSYHPLSPRSSSKSEVVLKIMLFPCFGRPSGPSWSSLEVDGVEASTTDGMVTFAREIDLP